MSVGGEHAERLRTAFFRAFFPLLLAAIALAEWAVVARLLARLGVPVPWPVHVLAPPAVWLANRGIASRLRTTAARPAWIRVYTAFAFTSVFCGVVLLFATVLWAAIRVGTLPVEAVQSGLIDVGRLARHFDAAVDGLLLGIVALFTGGYTVGQRRLSVTRLRVPVRGLPSELAGFRIVHLSDIHIGQHLGRKELAAHVARVNALGPDLVCITGDLVDRVDGCAIGFPVLAELRARHGVVATLGNHDHAAGADAVAAALAAHTPFTVLRDGRTEIALGEARLAIVGLDDLGRDWARGVPEHPALDALAAEVPPGATFLVLTHRPDCFPHAARRHAHLVLAGHTHGGQIGLPALGRRVRNLAEFITAYDRGVFRERDTTLVVSRGLGFTGQRIRLFTSREIGVLELQPA
jgi:predicted MPP superfamily phosphohydrolase